MRAPACRMDHLVVAAASLEQGAAWLENLLGVVPSPGGEHAGMGTHNRLLRLGPRLYLEVIAINPAAPPPGRPRWFGLDSAEAAARLRERPHLIHWVASTGDIASASAACPEHLGEILEMSRGDFRWRISVPASGRLPGDGRSTPHMAGLVPSLIQWDTPAHPAERLPDAGCSLMKLEGFHPEPSRIRGTLAALGLENALALFSAEAGEAPALLAYLRTPTGLRELD